MSVLKNLESKIAGVVEGTFSSVFRSQVRPVELARRLAREMEEHQSQSLSRVYVPNEYRVYLSPRDRDRFLDYEDALADELGSYLLEHARREHFAMLSAPIIEFETDARLGLGRFGIETDVVNPHELEAGQELYTEPPSADRTMVRGAPARVAAPGPSAPGVREPRAVLLHGGRRLSVGIGGATIGRSRDCDVVVDDPNVSRRHAEVRPRGDGWVLSDLGSTNGSRLNGRPVSAPTSLQPGDEIEVGATAIGFELG